jgi:AbrB family looped-hinge helix DNA binding protein
MPEATKTLARLSTRGRLVIPKDVRDRMGIKAGDVLSVQDQGDVVIVRLRNGESAQQDGALGDDST